MADRKDAKQVKLPAINQMMIDLKPKRSDSEVYINRKMDVTNLVDYINKKKEEGIKYTYFHAFLTAIARVVYNRKKLNYFINDRHLYEHNDIKLGFVAKIAFEDNAEEVMIIYDVKDDDNINKISERIKEKLDILRNKRAMKKEGANGAIDVLGKLPNIIRIPIMGLIKFVDQKGLLPASLAKDNLYYTTMIISNLGSIKCGSIYHNLNDFGNSSSLSTIGEIKPEIVVDKEGNESVRMMCDFGITLDERVADGFYFAKSCQMIEYILSHPEMLEEPVSQPVEME